MLLALLVLPCAGFFAWGALALHYAGPRPPALADALAATWLAAAVVIALLVRPFARALLAVAIVAGLLLAWWTSIRPRNDRDWLLDVANPPTAELRGDLLTVHSLRNFDYRSETTTHRAGRRAPTISRGSTVSLSSCRIGDPRRLRTRS